MQNTYTKDGLLYFSELENDPIQIVTTYDNSVWGNMNPKFATTPGEYEIITQKDIRIQKILGTQLAYGFTIPPEDTLIDLDANSTQLLENNIDADSLFKYIAIKANAGILYPSNGVKSYIFAPRDCPIFFIIPPEREFILAIHLGAPQIVQNIHNKIFRLANELIGNCDFKNSKVFITPHISGEHYYVSDEKFLMYKNIVGNEVSKFTKQKFNEIYRAERNYIDFAGFVKEDINRKFGITDFIDTGICTYESTQTGHLYSYKYLQEVEKRIERGEQIDSKKYLGSHNVVIKF